jgi:DNA-directed RNA polymerase subunit F
MHNDQIKQYDFSNDDLGPRAVLQHLKAHDARMKELQPILSLVKAAYETRFWKWVATRESTEKYRLGRPDRVEVNRLQSAIHDYLAALYPRRLDVSIARCATTVGDPHKAQLVANQWLNDTKMRTRLLQGAGQALLYRGAGAKVGFDSGEGPVLRRTWARIFPYWELVTDEQVHDEDDARFIGHVSYKPKGEVEAQYGIELNGQARVDYLADDGTGTNPSDKNTDSDMNAFVRVLEFCNLIDNFIDEHGNEHEGRLEIYIVDENNNEHSFKKPIWMGPLPLVDGDGKGMPHIAPLLFTRELEHPMKGLSYAERLLPQIIELNTFRSHAALAARRDARSYLYRRGAVSDEDLDKLTRGDDGVIIGVDRKYAGQLRDVVVPIQHGPISGNVIQMMSVAERDLESIKTAPTAALGFIKNVTAEAVKATVGHTESEFGRHAEELDKWMVQILKLFFAACVSAMQDTGDSSVGEDVTPGSLGDMSQDEALRLIDLDDYREEEQEEPEEEREPEYTGQPDDPELFPEDEPSDLDEDEAVLIETVEVTVVQTDNPQVAESLATTETSIQVLDKDGESAIHITAADLDSDFVIGFSETGRSPVGNVELRENILRLAPLVEQYFGLMLQGGSPSALATTMLKVLHDKFQLPPSFHPDALRLAAKEAQDEPSMMPEQPEGEGAPPAEGAPPEEGADQAIAQIAEIAQQDPAAALAMLAEVLPPEQHDILTSIASLPPEEQTQQILDLLSKLAPGGAPQAPESSPEEVLAQLAQIAQEDPAAALAMLAEVLPPEQHDILQKIGALPPEEQTQQILDLLSKLQPKPE